MTIHPVENNCVIIKTPNGDFHVSQEKDGTTHLCMFRHFRLVVHGRTKQNPLVTLDSDEYPTRLCVLDSEDAWTKEPAAAQILAIADDSVPENCVEVIYPDGRRSRLVNGRLVPADEA